MDAGLVSLIIDAVFGVFILLGFLFGLKGIKKATRKIVVFFVDFIIILLIAPTVSKLVLNLQISGMSLNDRIMNVAREALGENLASNSIVQEVMKNIPILIVDIAVSMVLIFVVGLILRIITAIIFGIKNKKKLKNEEETVEIVNGTPQVVKAKVKENKHRLAGGLVGAVHGLLLAIVLFLPIFGLVNIFNDISGVSSVSAETQSTESNSAEIKTMEQLIQDNVPDMVFDYAKAVDNSIFFKMGKVGGFSEVMLNLVSKCNINGETIRLGNEIRAVSKAYDSFVDFALSSTSDLTDYTFSNVINDLIDNPDHYNFNKLNKTVDALFESRLVVALGNDVLIFAVDTINDSTTDANTTQLLDHVSIALNNYASAKYSLKDDFKSLVGFFEVSAKSGLISEVRKSTFKVSNLKDILLNDADTANGIPQDKVLNDLTKRITDSNLLQKLILEGTNYGVEKLQDVLNNNLTFKGYDSIRLKQIDSSKKYAITASQLNNIIKDGISGYESVEGLKFDEITNDFYVLFDGDIVSLTKSAGKLINSILDLSMLKDTGVFDSVCDSMALTKYSDYVDFTALKNGKNVSEQFNLISGSIQELIDSGVITTLRNSELNNNAKINDVIDKLAVITDGKTRANKILTPILNCNIFKNSYIYGLNYAHDTIAKSIKSLNEEATISDFNTTNILTERENEQLLSIIDNLIAYAKDIDVSKLSSDDIIDTVLNSDLSLLGNAFDSLKNSTLLSSSGNNQGAYCDILDSLQNTKYADIFDFSIAKNNDFIWNTELTKVSDLIENLNDITVDGENLIKYLMNGGDYNAVLDNLTEEKVSNIKPMFEIDIIKPVGIKVVNSINETVKSFVGEEIGSGIEEVDNTINLKDQAQSITDMIACAIKIDFDATDIDSLNKDDFNALLDALSSNASVNGIFTETYNAILIKVVNMVNENIKEMVGVDTAGVNITTITTNVNVLNDEQTIRNVINKSFDMANSFDNLDIKTLDVDELFEFIDVFADSSTTANGVFAQTHNALLIYCINTINQRIYDSIGADLYGTNVQYTGTEDVRAYSNNIKNVITTAHNIYVTLDDGNIEDLNATNLDTLLSALSSNVYVSGSVNAFNRSYNAILLKSINTINEKVKDMVGATTAGKNITLFTTYTDVSADGVAIRNVINSALDMSDSFNNLDVKTLNTNELFDFIDVFGNNATIATGKFDATYNALLVYCINTVNEKIYDSVGATYYNDYTVYNGDQNVRSLRVNIKNIVDKAHDAFSSLNDSQNLEDLDQTTLNALYDALDSTTYTRPSKVAIESYLASKV